MKLLFLDVETSPNTAFCWGIWQENIPIDRLIDSSVLLCYTAKWAGERQVIFDSSYKSSHYDMLTGLHKLLDEADAVVTYNGDKFDLKVVNKEFLVNGFPPPSPSKSVDLYKTVKDNFRFVSNKLTYICEHLGLGSKINTNFKLWVDCMNNDPKAWKHMEKYNKHDVALLEELFETIKPWVKSLPNYSVLNQDDCCPRCGSHDFQSRGYSYTRAGKYTRYQCNECFGWFRGNKTQAKTEKFLGV